MILLKIFVFFKNGDNFSEKYVGWQRTTLTILDVFGDK